MRILPLILVLAAPGLASARTVVPATEAPVRLGFEGGFAWYNAFPDEAVGPAGLLRARVQLTQRFQLNGAFAYLDQPFGDTGLQTMLLPVTVDLRLDRAPIAPYLGAGVAGIHAADVFTWGTVFEAGVEWRLTDRWAISAQASYTGLRLEVFPFFSSLTAGLQAGL